MLMAVTPSCHSENQQEAVCMCTAGRSRHVALEVEWKWGGAVWRQDHTMVGRAWVRAYSAPSPVLYYPLLTLSTHTTHLPEEVVQHARCQEAVLKTL